MITSDLTELALKYFKRRGYKVERNVSQEGFSGLSRSFDMLVQRGDERHPVWIKDWKRTVGVNIIINIDRAAEDAGYLRPMVVAEKFSDHARAYANRRGIRLITKFEIRRSLM
ncbi:MAG: restriction endonuclease [Candidatus Bathyarchaeia archaeon]